MNLVIVGVGSNIDPYENVRKAKELLLESHTIIKSSRFIKTKPVGFKEQDDFLNGGWLVQTNLCKQTFKKFLNEIEDMLGRVRTGNKNGPRTIDLDIVSWNGDLIDDDYYERDFLKAIVKELEGTE